MMQDKGRVTGVVVERYDTKSITETFRVREFVVKIESQSSKGDVYEDYVKMQCTQRNIELLDDIRVGNSVIAEYFPKGSKYEKDSKTMYYTNLNCVSIMVTDNISEETHTENSSIKQNEVLDFDTQKEMIDNIKDNSNEVDNALYNDNEEVLF